MKNLLLYQGIKTDFNYSYGYVLYLAYFSLLNGNRDHRCGPYKQAGKFRNVTLSKADSNFLAGIQHRAVVL